MECKISGSTKIKFTTNVNNRYCVFGGGTSENNNTNNNYNDDLMVVRSNKVDIYDGKTDMMVHSDN